MVFHDASPTYPNTSHKQSPHACIALFEEKKNTQNKMPIYVLYNKEYTRTDS